MAHLVHELLSFCLPQFDRQATVQTIALQNLLQFTPATSPHRSMFSAKVSGHPQQATWITVIAGMSRRESLGSVGQHAAINILVNLTDGLERVNLVLKDSQWLPWAVKTILDKNALLADPASMLLSNLTQKSDALSTSLVSLKDESDNSVLPALVDVFAQGADKQYNPHASYHFLASVFANLSTLPYGRQALLDLPKDEKGETAITKIAAFTEHPDPVRRGGVASILKNLSFQTASHSELLEAHNLLPRIMLPLCGPEEYPFEELDQFPPEIQLLPPTQQREADPAIRVILLEALLLLTNGGGKEHLREKNVYRVIQVAHLAEDDERCKDLQVRLVGGLMREELSKNIPGRGEGEKIQEVDPDEDLQVTEM